MNIWKNILAAGLLAVAVAVAGVATAPASAEELAQGYVEGEFVWVGLPGGGVLAELGVERGASVEAGDMLFRLDDGRELAARDAAVAALKAARARLLDLSKGSRDSEVAAVQAELAEARAEADLAKLTLERQEQLRKTSAASEQAFDLAAARYVAALARIDKAEARLVTVGLAAREDRLAAAAAEVEGAEARLREQEWALSQRSAFVPTGGLAPTGAYVQDTFYRPGEFVPAGRPVVSLLPPGNVKLRFFVSETRIATLRAGDIVGFSCDGCPDGLTARVNYIAARAEFTPPVIYSEDVRDKLVFLVEAVPTSDPASFHPGQPVDVTLP